MSGLTFYMHDGPKTFRFELAGALVGVEVARLDQAWRTACSTFDGKTPAVDVTFVTAADERGRDLLLRWWREGARLVASSDGSRKLVEEMTGLPYAPAAVGPTFEPRFTTAFRAAVVALMVAGALLFPAKASAFPGHGMQLKQETLDAWDQYLQRADARMADRARGQFLWADETHERLRRVRAGEVVVMGHTPETAPSGLIHHWTGAAFVAGARMDDVMAVVRDYERYTEYYKPSVVEARTLSRRAEEDRFTVVVIDKAMFMRRALDSEYQSRFRQVDATRWYSVAQTTRVQELSDTRRIPDGEGSGYIWRLATISRYEERDGGVYIETEAMALSRPIPMTLHWVVDPIVRRVSRASLETSLEQTRDATGSVAKAEAGLTAWRLRRASSNIR